MKKTLMVLGGIFGAIILFAVAVFGYGIAHMYLYGSQLDEESKTWVDEIVPKITSSWDVNQILANASPELLQAASEEQLRELTAALAKKIGPLKTYKGSEGQAIVRINNGVKTINAEYVAFADFQNGSAEISIRGSKKDNDWKLDYFYVNSPVFMR